MSNGDCDDERDDEDDDEMLLLRIINVSIDCANLGHSNTHTVEDDNYEEIKEIEGE